jgi:mRNA interferase MazF
MGLSRCASDAGTHRVVTVSQGEVWWTQPGERHRAEPGFRRPVLVIQGDGLNRSRIGAVVCIALTSNFKWAAAPGNVHLSGSATGLPKDSVANVSQIVTLDKSDVIERAGKLPGAKLALVLSGVDVVLGR